MHPSEALFQGRHLPATLPVCDHYAGAEKLMRKSLTLQQAIGPRFDITFDCEDGAAASAESAHAEMVGTLIASDDNRFDRVGVRVQDFRHPSFELSVRIICALASKRLAYVTVPKIGSAAELEHVVSIVNRYAEKAGRFGLPIQVLIETHGALTDVFAIARHPQVQALSFGIMDFVSAHYGAIPSGAMRSPEQFLHPLVRRAKLEIAAACHAFGKVASHNVTTEINDTNLVMEDARCARREFGYGRMWSIHPNQIEPILAAFTPSQPEIVEASTILCSAFAKNWAPIQHNGTLHDRASYRYYWTVLQRARLSGMQLPDAAAEFLRQHMERQ
ncbi:MAG: aldolase/citrate lyase family protein [Pseudomonadota bacterium]